MKACIGIVGTGLAGLTLAAALAQAGFDVALYGPKPQAEKDARTTAVLQPNIEFLKSLGLWPGLSERATPLMTMELNDAGTQSVFTSVEMGLDQFGFNLVNTDLKEALLKQIAASKITWRTDNVENALLDKKGWRLQFAKGKEEIVRLLIGADGRNSLVRTAAGIETTEKEEDQSALVVQLVAEKNHHYTSVEWYRSGGPLTLVPCAGKQIALVWCDKTDIIDAQLKKSDTTLSNLITDMTESRFGQLTLTSRPQKWPVRPMKSHTLIAPHLALVGEAAHVLPPIGAQGFNTSLYDIQSLLAQLKRGRDLGLPVDDATILRAYDEARRFDVATRYHGITRLNDLIRSDSAGSIWARKIMMGALNCVTPLRRSVMKFALHPRKGNAA